MSCRKTDVKFNEYEIGDAVEIIKNNKASKISNKWVERGRYIYRLADECGEYSRFDLRGLQEQKVQEEPKVQEVEKEGELKGQMSLV